MLPRIKHTIDETNKIVTFHSVTHTGEGLEHFIGSFNIDDLPNDTKDALMLQGFISTLRNAAVDPKSNIETEIVERWNELLSGVYMIKKT